MDVRSTFSTQIDTAALRSSVKGDQINRHIKQKWQSTKSMTFCPAHHESYLAASLKLLGERAHDALRCGRQPPLGW